LVDLEFFLLPFDLLQLVLFRLCPRFEALI
jgi:hypothetical protein